LLLPGVVLLNACQPESAKQPTTSPILPTMTQTNPSTFRVIGYVTTSVEPDTIPYDKVTHINYAFLLPKSDGNFETKINAWKIDRIVRDARPHGVKVLISVGGWGYADEFETMAANPETRRVFIINLLEFIEEHQLNGIDIDWEYPAEESRDNFLALVMELRNTLPPGKLLTAAVASHGKSGEGIPAASFKYFDFFSVMAYDGIEHASLNHAQVALDYWLSRGIPKGKLVLGVPFYSRPIAIPYQTLLELDPAAAYVDEIQYQETKITYNGIPSIQTKTRIALRRASGIMIWNLEFDSHEEETSLLKAISTTIQENK
jgi:GH18 family chitinase